MRQLKTMRVARPDDDDDTSCLQDDDDLQSKSELHGSSNWKWLGEQPRRGSSTLHPSFSCQTGTSSAQYAGALRARAGTCPRLTYAWLPLPSTHPSPCHSLPSWMRIPAYARPTLPRESAWWSERPATVAAGQCRPPPKPGEGGGLVSAPSTRLLMGSGRLALSSPEAVAGRTSQAPEDIVDMGGLPPRHPVSPGEY